MMRFVWTLLMVITLKSNQVMIAGHLQIFNTELLELIRGKSISKITILLSWWNYCTYLSDTQEWLQQPNDKMWRKHSKKEEWNSRIYCRIYIRPSFSVNCHVSHTPIIKHNRQQVITWIFTNTVIGSVAAGAVLPAILKTWFLKPPTVSWSSLTVQWIPNYHHFETAYNQTVQ
jgi:hypothetical protein